MGPMQITQRGNSKRTGEINKGSFVSTISGQRLFLNILLLFLGLFLAAFSVFSYFCCMIFTFL